jgi:hypothetical protein
MIFIVKGRRSSYNALLSVFEAYQYFEYFGIFAVGVVAGVFVILPVDLSDGIPIRTMAKARQIGVTRALIFMNA